MQPLESSRDGITIPVPGRVSLLRPRLAPFRAGLSLKLLLAVVAISLVGVLASSFLLLGLLRQQFIEDTKSSVARLNRPLETSLEHAMLAHDHAMLDTIVRDVASELGDERIRIVDPNGFVRSSSLPEEINTQLDQSRAECTAACHLGRDVPAAASELVSSSDGSGEQRLLSVSSIDNRPSCSACHDARHKTLGIIMIDAPLTGLDRRVQEGFWRVALGALVTFVLLVGLLTPALRRLIIAPVGELSRGVAAIGAGNLDYRVRLRGDDELGRLAASFDAMREQLRASRGELRLSAREALTLYHLGTKVSSSLELDQVLDAVAAGARDVLAGDMAMVGVLDAERQELAVQALAGAYAGDWRGLRVPVQQLRVFTVVVPVVLADRPPELPAALAPMWDAEHLVSLLAVPLLRAGRPHGLIAVMARTRREFSEEEIRLLTRLAQQVVVAVENARLYRQVRYLAALEERDRLAREMHDDLAQALGYLNLKATITGDLLAQGQSEQAQASLQEMKQITRQTYTDVREAIFSLRNAVALGADLLATLRDYVADYRAHYGLDTQLVVEEAARIEFSTEVAVQLSRIIQEALTNIRKHAQASRAWVRFEREGDEVRVIVEDNGRGFDPQEIQARDDREPHFGLQIMRERAASVGAILEFDPQAGRGTRVVVRFPAQPAARGTA